LIISDLGNKCIRRINVEDGLVVTISSISSASKKTSIQYPTGVAFDIDEKHILVADSKRNSVLRVNARSGATLHLASLPLVHGQRSQIHDIVVDDGGYLFVTHTRGISKIHPKSRTVSHVASSYHTGWMDGAFEVAQFKNPHGLCFLSSSEILVADSENHVIRHLDLKNMLVSTYAGCGENGSEDGPSRSAKFSFPKKITVDVMRALVFVTERGEYVRIIDMNTRFDLFALHSTMLLPSVVVCVSSFQFINGSISFSFGVFPLMQDCIHASKCFVPHSCWYSMDFSEENACCG
jgi:hypothetical protein